MINEVKQCYFKYLLGGQPTITQSRSYNKMYNSRGYVINFVAGPTSTVTTIEDKPIDFVEKYGVR